MATLTSSGGPVRGQYVDFFLYGRKIGEGLTNDQGIAYLDGADIAGTTAGVFPNAVTAVYAGGVDFGPSVASGTLNLSPKQEASA